MDMASAFKKAADNNPKLATKISQVEELRKIEKKEREKELKEISKERQEINKLILNGNKTVDILNDPIQMGGVEFSNIKDSLIFSNIIRNIRNIRNISSYLKGHYKDCKCFSCGELGTRRLATFHALSELHEELGFGFLIDDKKSANFYDRLKEKVGIMVDEFNIDGETKYICSPCRVKLITDIEKEIDQAKTLLSELNKKEINLKKDLKKL